MISGVQHTMNARRKKERASSAFQRISLTALTRIDDGVDVWRAPSRQALNGVNPIHCIYMYACVSVYSNLLAYVWLSLLGSSSLMGSHTSSMRARRCYYNNNSSMYHYFNTTTAQQYNNTTTDALTPNE